MAAFVGHSGAGKSTIINLLPRFYDPQDGVIEIDGQNIKDVSLSSLRKNLSLVSQDIILYDFIMLGVTAGIILFKYPPTLSERSSVLESL